MSYSCFQIQFEFKLEEYISEKDIITVYTHYLADIDECSLAVLPCDFGQDCANTEGSFVCTCRSGFELNDMMNCIGRFRYTYSTYSNH